MQIKTLLIAAAVGAVAVVLVQASLTGGFGNKTTRK